MYSTLVNFCFPALFFLVIVLVDIVFVAFGKSKNQSKPLDKKIKIFLLLSLCALGWSFIINSTCGNQQYIAWGLTAIPLLYLSFTLYK
jgi:hypothetical protein